MTDEETPKIPYFSSFEEYLTWTQETKQIYNPHLCARHWWPMVKSHQDGESSKGIVLSIILMTEALQFLPEDIRGPENYQAINSWFAETTTPTCCKLGDEKMEWLWWLFSQEQCLATAFPEHPKGVPACLFPKGHTCGHTYRISVSSFFDHMKLFPLPYEGLRYLPEVTE